MIGNSMIQMKPRKKFLWKSLRGKQRIKYHGVCEQTTHYVPNIYYQDPITQNRYRKEAENFDISESNLPKYVDLNKDLELRKKFNGVALIGVVKTRRTPKEK